MTETVRETLERIQAVLKNGLLPGVARHFDTGSEEWAIIHNATESMSLGLEAATKALTQLEVMERDREAMVKLRELGGIVRNYRQTNSWYFYPDSGGVLHSRTHDPADAILGKQDERR